MRKLKKNEFVEEAAVTPAKQAKHEVVHRPLKEGMLPIDIVHEAANRSTYSLRSHADALRPFISPKVYAQLISFEGNQTAQSSPGDSLYFKAEPGIVTVDSTLPAADSITSLTSLGAASKHHKVAPFSPAATSSSSINHFAPPRTAATTSFHRAPTTPLEGLPAQITVPASIKATLRDYQVTGVSWLVDRYDRCVNCILADEMGLGKTLQTITFFAYLKAVRGEGGPHLVVVPLSVMFNWVTELKKFCPSLKVLRAHRYGQQILILLLC